MNDPVAVVLTWLTASAILVAGLGLVNIVSEFGRFRSEEIPRPWFVVCRRVRGALLQNSFARVTQRGDNRTAWLSWDFRWVTAGQTVVQIIKFNPETRELYLQLGNPIVLTGTEEQPPVRMERVWFVPRDPHRAAYDRSAVQGTLRPEFPGGMIATAEIVVYPD